MNDNKRRVLSANLSMDDYNLFLMLTKIASQAGLIKEESTSELLRFTIKHILNQLHNNLIYTIPKEQEQQQKKAQNNQQRLVNPVILSSSTSVAASYQHQPSNNISRRNNLVSQKMTPWKLLSSSLLSTQMNHHTF